MEEHSDGGKESPGPRGPTELPPGVEPRRVAPAAAAGSPAPAHQLLHRQHPEAGLRPAGEARKGGPGGPGALHREEGPQTGEPRGRRAERETERGPGPRLTPKTRGRRGEGQGPRARHRDQRSQADAVAGVGLLYPLFGPTLSRLVKASFNEVR